MAIKHFTTSININESNNINIGVIKQNDNIKLEISIFKDTMPLDLSQNSIKSIFKRSDKLILEQIKDINTENNKVIINIKNKATAINGILEMELELIDNLGKCITQTFYFTILPIIPLNQALENTNNIESLELLKNIKFDDVVLNNNILTFMANTKQIKSIELQLNPTKNNNSFWKPMISKECLLSWEKSNSIIPPEPKNIKGDTGATGAKGEPGIKGDTGATGAKGEPGTEGKSAYQIWLSLGNTGTEQDFINTFKGIKGDKGDTGATGATGAKGEPGVKGDTGATGAKGEPGIKGDTGATGAKGEPGTEGKSAYQIWLSLGNTGTEQDFINTFKGIKGDKGDTGATGATGAKGEPGVKGDTGATGAKGEPGIKGDTGATGAKGEPGTEGKSAYQIWLSLGNTGTEQDFINTFKGIKGDKGDTGATGATGAKGEPGIKGDTGATGAKGEPGTFNINENYPTLNTTNKTVLGAINEINSKSTGGNGNNNVIPKVTTAPLENEIFLSQLAGATYKFRNQQSVTVNGNDILFNTNDSAIEIEFTSNGAIEIDVNKKSNGYYLINSNTGQDNIPWESKLKKYVFLGVTGNYIRIIVNNSGWGVTVNSKSINDLCFNSIVGIKNFAFSQLKMTNEINILKNEINTLKQVIYNISVLPKS